MVGEPERLFDLPAVEPHSKPESEARRWQALGVAAELVLTARLLELGHKVAKPVTDDDGVDLIVDYSMLVQIKSTGQRTVHGDARVLLESCRASERKYGRGMRNYVDEHVDVLAVYARDTRAWWFIPRDHVQTNGMILLVSEHPGDPWFDAWWVFDGSGC